MIPIFKIINSNGICIAWTPDSEIAVKINNQLNNQHRDTKIKIEWQTESEE